MFALLFALVYLGCLSRFELCCIGLAEQLGILTSLRKLEPSAQHGPDAVICHLTFRCCNFNCWLTLAVSAFRRT